MAKRLSYSNLLIAESPMLVSPLIAFIFHDSDKAIVLQHIYYWTHFSKSYRKTTKESHKGYFEESDEKWVIPTGTELQWVFQTFKEWQKTFFWLKIGKVTKVMQSLVNEGYLLAENFNKLPMDQTLWYTINPEIGRLLARKINITPGGNELAQKVIENQANVRNTTDLAHVWFETDRNGDLVDESELSYKQNDEAEEITDYIVGTLR